MSRTTAAITLDRAREILGDAIITTAPQVEPRTCAKPRCTNCNRHARLHMGVCRSCR